MLHHYVVGLNKQDTVELSVVGPCNFSSRVLYLELHYAQVIPEAASDDDEKK